MSYRKVQLEIPDGIKLADLKLQRLGSGDSSYDLDVVEKILDHNGIDRSVFFSTEDNMAELITVWYHRALAEGEPRDAVQDAIISEALSEYN